MIIIFINDIEISLKKTYSLLLIQESFQTEDGGPSVDIVLLACLTDHPIPRVYIDSTVVRGHGLACTQKVDASDNRRRNYYFY